MAPRDVKHGQVSVITRQEFLWAAAGVGLSTALQPGSAWGQALTGGRPNILWLSCEDIGPHLGCYGDLHAITPVLDRLAAEGVRYANAFTTAGVCAPNRSCVITGMYATTLGTHHMRSGGEGAKRSVKPELPPEVKCFPEYLRAAGYYCTNNSKEDYNFPTPASAWDESSAKAHWRNRPRPDQPFFAAFNYTGTHEGSVRSEPPEYAKWTVRLREDQRQDPARITPPPYHADTAVIRRQWANYYECITALDYWVADFLQQLEEDGLAGTTIVLFWSDHGAGLARCKRWLYDSGTHIPLIVRIPEPYRDPGQGRAGTVDERLVSSVDLAPTVMNLAGIPIPAHIQGRSFLGPDLPPERQYIYGARDRMDERYDIIRMVRDKRYRYIRNYEPFKPYDQHIDYAERSPLKMELNRLAKKGGLPPEAAWVSAKHKPVEEIYDTREDPHEVNNLSEAPEYGPILERLRAEHDRWSRETNDLGWIPEPELVVLEKKYGRRYAIWPHLDRDAPVFREALRSAVLQAGQKDSPALLAALASPYAAVRYWAAIGIGNLGRANAAEVEALTQAMRDSSPTVRVVAAQALLEGRQAEKQALSVLTAELASPDEWVRLYAATALDSAEEQARPAISALKAALNDTENKYVARVANHALNQMLGTSHEVR